MHALMHKDKHIQSQTQYWLVVTMKYAVMLDSERVSEIAFINYFLCIELVVVY